ncbi:hypothetical protein MKZ38_009562 [Zalerion maritima]|uniref:Uncharacterized protein n=1 Tax=Zalerion maritima TaxID=339359 RepID=A0AAD5RUD3_9PEZI|nr:hypothetical protein MKZ38_009562 [Zalerion maritima]
MDASPIQDTPLETLDGPSPPPYHNGSSSSSSNNKINDKNKTNKKTLDQCPASTRTLDERYPLNTLGTGSMSLFPAAAPPTQEATGTTQASDHHHYNEKRSLGTWVAFMFIVYFCCFSTAAVVLGGLMAVKGGKTRFSFATQNTPVVISGVELIWLFITSGTYCCCWGSGRSHECFSVSFYDLLALGGSGYGAYEIWHSRSIARMGGGTEECLDGDFRTYEGELKATCEMNTDFLLGFGVVMLVPM